MSAQSERASKSGAIRQPFATTAIFIGFTVVVVVSAFVFGPRFPNVDSAFFEYVGRSLTGGSRLYSDLWDNKLPSIFLVNAMWWLLFGDNYRLHLLGETVINAGSIVLFALILRRFAISVWPVATLAFSIFYLFVGGPPNQTEHYATPLILFAVLCASYKRYVVAGCALALASTFWIPAFIAGGVPIVVTAAPRARWTFLCALLLSGIALAAGFLLYFGSATTLELLQSWVSYEAGNYGHSGRQTVHHSYLFPQLSPAYYIPTGLGALLFTAATFWHKPVGQPARFACWWSAATLVVVLALGQPFLHYFLPLYGPLILLITSEQFSLPARSYRWLFAALAGMCVVAMTVLKVIALMHPSDAVLEAIVYSGQEIHDTYGDGAVAVLPWEAYLPSYAVPPSRFFLSRVVVMFAAERDHWVRRPQVYVDDANGHFTGVQPPRTLKLICRNQRTGPLMIYSSKPIAGMPCLAR